VDKGRYVGFTEGIKGYRVIFPDGAFVHSRDVTFDESVTHDSATVPWAVESDSGDKIINPSPDVTDALADLLAGGVSSSESPDSESPIVSLDVDLASPVHAQCMHVMYNRMLVSLGHFRKP
jgi:hypothetical protein